MPRPVYAKCCSALMVPEDPKQYIPLSYGCLHTTTFIKHLHDFVLCGHLVGLENKVKLVPSVNKIHHFHAPTQAMVQLLEEG